jgi:hypothetical protein
MSVKKRKYEITLPLPDLKDVATSNYLTIENMRQAQFDVIYTYLKSCYMKFHCKNIITGDTYASRSSIVATTTVDLNAGEVRKTLEFLGFKMEFLDTEDWRDNIKPGSGLAAK